MNSPNGCRLIRFYVMRHFSDEQRGETQGWTATFPDGAITTRDGALGLTTCGEKVLRRTQPDAPQ